MFFLSAEFENFIQKSLKIHQTVVDQKPSIFRGQNENQIWTKI